MDKKVLVKDLATRIRKYSSKAQLVDIDFKNLGETVFVNYKGETLFNPKYIKIEDYFVLKAFESFLKRHPELSKEEVLEVVKSDKKEFEFLKAFNSKMPTMIEDIKSSGAKTTVISYISGLLYGKEENLSV